MNTYDIIRLNNDVYFNVLEYELDQAEIPSNLLKLFISKSQGLIAFSSKENELFVIQ